MSSATMRIGVCGVGTVGLATIEILRRQGALIAARTGRDIQVTHVGARRDHADHDYGDCLLYTSPSPRDKRQTRMPSSA